MAFIQNNPDDQGQNQSNLNNQMQQNSGAAQPTPISSPMTSLGGTAPGQSTPPVSKVQQPKGSGRFTNLQKYVQANTGAGERLASSVNRQMEKGYRPFKAEANTQQQNVQTGLQQGQQAIQTGQGLNTQMSADTFTPEKAVEFINQGNNLAQVSAFRTGQGVDEAAIQKQKQAFEQATANLGQKVDERGQQVGTELGRINLLKEAFGGQNRGQYSAGSSRLDNLLLQAQPGNLQALNQNVFSNKENVQRLQQKAVEQGKTLEQVIADENALQTAIQGTTAANVDKFKTGLGNQVEGFNQGIESKIKTGNEFVDFYNKALTDQAFKDKYGMSKSDYKFNQDLWNKFGLQEGQQTFNVFNNADLNLGQVADIESRRAQDWRDVANQANVGQYSALAQLKGLTQPEYELTKASDINQEGYTLAQDQRGLQNRINQAKRDFMTNAANQLIAGSTQNVYDQSGTGYVSLADYLRNPDFYSRAQVVGTGGSGNLDLLRSIGQIALAPGLGGAIGSDAAAFDNTSTYLKDRLGGTLGTVASIPLDIAEELHAGLSFGANRGRDAGDQSKDWKYVTQRSIGSGFTDPSVASFLGSSTGQALQNYLANAGFTNYLTQGGTQQDVEGAEHAAKKFGYRTDAQSADTREGFYNPMFEERKILEAAGLSPQQQQQAEASTQVTGQSGPMSADEALAAARNQAPRLTREQIAGMATTSSDSQKAALRQKLIEGNKYLTSQPEMQEIINRELGGIDMMGQAKQTLADQYMQSLGGFVNRGGFTLNNSNPNMSQTEAEFAAKQAYTKQPQSLGSFQDYLNNLAGTEQQAALDRASKQVYGTQLDRNLAGAPKALTTQQILDSIAEKQQINPNYNPFGNWSGF